MCATGILIHEINNGPTGYKSPDINKTLHEKKCHALAATTAGSIGPPCPANTDGGCDPGPSGFFFRPLPDPTPVLPFFFFASEPAAAPFGLGVPTMPPSTAAALVAAFFFAVAALLLRIWPIGEILSWKGFGESSGRTSSGRIDGETETGRDAFG